MEDWQSDWSYDPKRKEWRIGNLDLSRLTFPEGMIIKSSDCKWEVKKLKIVTDGETAAGDK